MPTAFVHPNAQSFNARTQTSAGQPVIGHAKFTFLGAPVAGDTVKLTQIPKDARVLNCIMIASDLDTNGSPAITLSLGDSGSATRFFSASTIGQAGGTAELPVASTVKGYQYTADDYLLLTVVAGPATGATGGTVEAFLEYYL